MIGHANLGHRAHDCLDDSDREFADAVLSGLSQRQKSIPSRFLYDARGSALFEEITRLSEYYPTRTELGILSAHAAEMVEGLGEDGVLVEFGSGSSVKTELLLAQAAPGITYVPVDVSRSALSEAVARLSARFPQLDMRPVVGDFSKSIALPQALDGRPAVGFFPGSTIGNFEPRDAIDLLHAFGRGLPPSSRLVVGVDLKKDARTLVRAYNDSKGVTAAFNLNLLRRINRELGADFDLGRFRHVALYVPRFGRIEMHLESTALQEVRLLGRRFRFAAGESIHTENSHKFTIAEFQGLAVAAGWQTGGVWIDERGLFSVHELRNFDASSM